MKDNLSPDGWSSARPPISCTCSSWPPSSTAGDHRARSASWTRPRGCGRGSSLAPWSRCSDRSCHQSRKLAPARAGTPDHTRSTGKQTDTRTAAPGQREVRSVSGGWVLSSRLSEVHSAVSSQDQVRKRRVTAIHGPGIHDTGRRLAAASAGCSASMGWGFYYFSRFMVSCPVTTFPNPLPPAAEVQLLEDWELVKIDPSTSYKEGWSIWQFGLDDFPDKRYKIKVKLVI